MKRRAVTYKPSNGNSFKIIQGDGKAPIKLIFLNADGVETRRTHHKRVDLAFERARIWNPNWPVVNEIK